MSKEIEEIRIKLNIAKSLSGEDFLGLSITDGERLFSHISTLEEKVKELEAELDSETGWAKEYFDKWEKEEARVKELEALPRFGEQEIKRLEQSYKDQLETNVKLIENLKRLQNELQKWQRIRKPTHGPCCTCQRCGQLYDDCRCDLDETVDELEQTKSNLKRLRDAVDKFKNSPVFFLPESKIYNYTRDEELYREVEELKK
jgi:chromosome segregation ATPase